MESAEYLQTILINVFKNFLGFFPKDTIIISVPTTSKRFKQRGFNQSDIFAKRLAEFSGFKYLPILKRTDKSIQQAKLTRSDRLQNLRGSIYTLPTFKQNIFQKHIIIVDDIATTCSTLNECAKALKIFRPKEITAFVLARSYLFC